MSEGTHLVERTRDGTLWVYDDDGRRRAPVTDVEELFAAALLAAEKRAEEAEALLRRVISGEQTIVIEVALEDEIRAALAPAKPGEPPKT